MNIRQLWQKTNAHKNAISYQTFFRRIKRGMTPEQAAKTPIRSAKLKGENYFLYGEKRDSIIAFASLKGDRSQLEDIAACRQDTLNDLVAAIVHDYLEAQN